jgi:hypothetical protein
MSVFQILATAGSVLALVCYVSMVCFTVYVDLDQKGHRFSLDTRIALTAFIQGLANGLVVATIYATHPTHHPAPQTVFFYLAGFWLLTGGLIGQSNFGEGCAIVVITLVLTGVAVPTCQKVERKAQELQIRKAAAAGEKVEMPPQNSAIMIVPFVEIGIALAAALLQRAAMAAAPSRPF